jgi:hypothetical protein
LAVLLIPLWAGACAGATGGARPDNRNVLGRAQLEATNASTAYEAVQQLRPDFLRGRLVGSGNSVANETPIVFVDGTRRGDIEQLRTIPTSMILSIHLISASDATTRWGTGYPAGVIEVRTRT